MKAEKLTLGALLEDLKFGDEAARGAGLTENITIPVRPERKELYVSLQKKSKGGLLRDLRKIIDAYLDLAESKAS